VRRLSGHLARPDASLYYEVTGEGPAIVFAHGLGGNHLSWWQQVTEFAPRHTCVAFAHRGFPPSSGEGVPRYADDLAALMDHLEIERATLVCQSMGGWTGLEYSLARPARVAALVMASTSGTVDTRKLGIKDLDGWLASAALRMADQAKRGISLAAGERMASEQPALHGLYSGISALLPAARREAIRAELMRLRSRSPEVLAELKMPVLWITGGEDLVFPPQIAPELAKRTPGSHHIDVPKTGHSVYFERPDTFNRALREFLALSAA
jgi:pimeloyl-ACP methyl ester carboxylesterase